MTTDHKFTLAHIAIYTKDIEESILFYEKLGGCIEQRSVYHQANGDKLLALLNFAGIRLEFIQTPDPEEASFTEGVIPHFAIWTDNMDETAEQLKKAGILSFQTPQKNVLPEIFGGVENWYITGPSGEQIELLQKI